MKRITTIVCCIALMLAGVATAFWNYEAPSNKVAMASPPLHWGPNVTMPLDLQLDLEKRQNREQPVVRDSINIIDSVRWETKTLYRVRYTDVADRTTARQTGNHPAAATPDSLPEKPVPTSTVVREENATEIVDTSKVSSIQLYVDGEVVYSSHDSHSAGEGQ